MTPLHPFALAAQSWQPFYLLLGGAAATLIGLMFVAVSFGSGMITEENAETSRAFIDPAFSHFVHVLFTACLVVMPTMTATVFGALLLLGMVVRLAGLVWVYRHFRRAHALHGDLEASDWIIGIVLPGLAFALTAAAAVGIHLELPVAFTVLAAATLGVLMLGVRGAWELMLWLVTEVARRRR